MGLIESVLCKFPETIIDLLRNRFGDPVCDASGNRCGKFIFGSSFLTCLFYLGGISVYENVALILLIAARTISLLPMEYPARLLTICITCS